MFPEFEHPEKKGVICKYTTQWMRSDLEVLLDCIQKPSQNLIQRFRMPNVSHHTAWPGHHQDSSVFFGWLGFGSGWRGRMLHVQSDVDSEETTAGVFGRAPVFLSRHVGGTAKTLNQCFTSPGHSLMFFFFFFNKVLQTKTERMFSSAVSIIHCGSPTSL